ncbi:MAG: NAD(+)/NADH kinase, partial [Pseudomonadota bacterium]
MKLHFVSSQAPEAIKAAQKLKHLLGQAPRDDADVIVALGGDGLMLETVHTVLDSNQAIFGMNRGSVGFLMNEFETAELTDRIAAATETTIHPLKMTVTDKKSTT